MAKALKPVRTAAPEKAAADRKNEVLGILLVGLSLLGLASIYFSPAGNTSFATGILGYYLNLWLTKLAGSGRYILALLIGLWGGTVIMERRLPAMSHRIIGISVLFIVVLSFFHLYSIVGVDYWKYGLEGNGGGIIGATVAWVLTKSIGLWGAYIALSSLLVVTLLSLTNLSLPEAIKRMTGATRSFSSKVKDSLEDFIYVAADGEEEEAETELTVGDEPGFSIENTSPEEAPGKKPLRRPKPVSIVETEAAETQAAAVTETASPVEDKGPKTGFFSGRPMAKPSTDVEEIAYPEGYTLPTLELLQSSVKLKPARLTRDITENVRILEETMENFGVKAKVTHVSRGPAVTRYEVQPAPGIKVSKIVNLADDIALSMAAQHVRIEAPIPGKSAIGIEVPNKEVSVVHFREVLESRAFQESASKLTAALGKDIAGNPVVIDLVKMPHLLIAGATGMGKSVCLNSLISSVLFKASPNEVKFMMIDPKMVELTTYNGIPHLITPVVTNPKKAAVALRWAVTEMERRYEKFATWGAKDIVRYNQLMVKEGQSEASLPYIVIIIDELADLMMVAPADVEDAVCRLAQMARAAGLHLVVATQRPSVDVITGLIKANITSRIAFAVSSQTDSRTILDVNGAEKLIGRGDMLYAPVDYSKPIRVQGSYISDREVEHLVSFLKRQGKPLYLEGVTSLEDTPSEDSEEEDELFFDAVRLCINAGQASISLLQRRFRIGYTRAARLIDMMEIKGIVGRFEGSKPREVLLTIDQFEKQFGKF
ncbi:MAG: DNA translocase FtsK [Firmicutes bacterium]|nr:DNA translocase FtsK [Bacillota bacterium]